MSNKAPRRVGGGFNPVLLWENQNERDAFAAQTLTVPGLAKYDFVVVVVGYYLDSPLELSNFITKSSKTIMCCGPLNSYRTVAVDENSITIGAGKPFQQYGNGNATDNNSFCIPKAIYGLK